MRLFYDKTDLKHAKKLGDSRLAWLRELGATELSEAALDEPGFLFGYDLGLEHLEKQVASRPTLHDRPEERQELLALDHVLDRLHESGVDVPKPKGFPPSDDDLDLLRELAAQVALPFRSRLIVTDFVRDKKGAWHFLEAGPGAVAGTAHEGVFKHVAVNLIGQKSDCEGDDVGGPL